MLLSRKLTLTFLFALLFIVLPLHSIAATLEGIRLFPYTDKTRLVLDISNIASYKVFALKNPDRVVIDIKNGKQIRVLPLPSFSKTPIKGIRSAKKGKNDLRVVLDMKRAVQKIGSQLLMPYGNYSHRIVVDMREIPVFDSKKDEAVITQPTLRDIVIAIDAGHGGRDPGAIGKHGNKEKDIVLAVAKKLAKLVNDEPGMRAYLTRSDDIFVSLRGRIKRAHDRHADMFISIHADAVKNKKAKGASVYVLSERGASSEAARLLADKANAVDLAGSISLEDKDDLLASVLVDLSQEATLESSLKVASEILARLKRVGNVHKKYVESAAFMVLKSPDIPSVLVEIAFISNPDEERKLANTSHQAKLARAIMSGIRSYFIQNPPQVAEDVHQKHIVSGGENLSRIADRYQVSIKKLKAANRLVSTKLNIGDVLIIPND